MQASARIIVNGNENENHTAVTMCKYVRMNDYSEKSNGFYFYAWVGCCIYAIKCCSALLQNKRKQKHTKIWYGIWRARWCMNEKRNRRIKQSPRSWFASKMMNLRKQIRYTHTEIHLNTERCTHQPTFRMKVLRMKEKKIVK